MNRALLARSIAFASPVHMPVMTRDGRRPAAQACDTVSAGAGEVKLWSDHCTAKRTAKAFFA